MKKLIGLDEYSLTMFLLSGDNVDLSHWNLLELAVRMWSERERREAKPDHLGERLSLGRGHPDRIIPCEARKKHLL